MAKWDSFNSHQKLSLGLFVAIGVIGIILAPFLMQKTITTPFKRTGRVAFKTAEQVEREQTDSMRRMDTDNDGLNDYDEQYVFRTSPYVADTDSDLTDDGREVADNTDPNCPKGKTCRQSTLASGATAETAPTNGSTTTPPATQVTPPDEAKVLAVIQATFGDPNLLTPANIESGLQRMSVTDLRKFLGELGIPPSALQRADDATLRKLVSDTLNEIAAQNAALQATEDAE